MKKRPNVGDKAICYGYVTTYGVFEVLEVLPERPTILGYKCIGNYTDSKTNETIKTEKYIWWSKRDKDFRVA